MNYGWSRRSLAILFVVSAGVPVVLVLDAAAGWSRSAIGTPAWASWTIAALAICAGLPFAWAATPFGTRGATNLLLNAYRREGLESIERQYLSKLSSRRAGLQLCNLGLALERAGDWDGAQAVHRRAAHHGYPPAMVRLAYVLSRNGEEPEARDWYRRAVEAGYPLDPLEEADGE
ncbi:tetratricopeptide repeat protein [Streptomyces sp. NPDC005921]|uniref:tetratricopeptide repeat protein n=1 Tax=Streptomyces sp. NPDC005827 TaxID=3157070 RepID=UPI0033F27DBE